MYENHIILGKSLFLIYMKRSIILLLLIVSTQLFAQHEWAPIDAKWHFNQPSSGFGNFVVFESKKDSIIQGKSVHIIEVKINGTNLLSKEYIRQSKDSVFYFNSNTNKFYLLYNFAAKAGDTIVVHNKKFKPTKAFFSYYDSIDSFKYKVIATDSIQISSEWVRRQKVENLRNSSWGFTKPTGGDNDYIINKVGSITYFFGVFPGTYPEENLSILRCYDEAAFKYKNPAWNQACDIITELDEKISGTNAFLYQNAPNPFTYNTEIQYYLHESIVSATLFFYDMQGLQIKSIPIQQHGNASITINGSEFKAGMYIYTLIADGIEVDTKRMILTN